MSMDEKLRGVFEDKEEAEDKKQGYFKESEIAVDIFGVFAISKRKAANEKFRASFDVSVDHEYIADALASKAEVYVYQVQKRIKAVYIIRKDEKSVSCNDIYKSSDLTEEISEKLDRYFTFLVAKRAMNESLSVAIFNGASVPSLKSKTKFDFGMFLLWGMVMGCPFWLSLQNPAYLGCGLPLAIAMSIKTYYKYVE